MEKDEFSEDIVCVDDDTEEDDSEDVPSSDEVDFGDEELPGVYPGRRPSMKDHFPSKLLRAQYKRYCRQIEASEGFDVGDFSHVAVEYCGMIQPLPLIGTVRKEYRKHANLAIKEYNKDHNTKFKVEQVLKVNVQGCQHDVVYLTFSAIDKKAVDAAITPTTFQAKLVDDLCGYLLGSNKPEIYVHLCRPKPHTSDKVSSIARPATPYSHDVVSKLSETDYCTLIARGYLKKEDIGPCIAGHSCLAKHTYGVGEDSSEEKHGQLA